ncbi:hypothetical protein SteCoe_20867 [Stentor coeruleus]|uniref:Uncharacterized protein n=1 Tax=Stentor coeruleus TaxID=5963 RepID=A0A1R2BR11_9CILI|nr:hypothetical protein SteCoe_20867 [Stentor coeruleus]
MDKQLKLEDFILELEKEEQNIEKQKLCLKNDGILDENLDCYLTDSINLIRERKEKLIKDFYPTKPHKNIKIKHSPTSIPIKNTHNNNKYEIYHDQQPNTKSLYSVHNIQKKNVSPLATEIFRKKVSPERGNSPSAMRYSPQLFPTSSIVEKVKNLDILSGYESPVSSTRSSGSSIDKLVSNSTGNTDAYSYELYKKYQEKREIRNRAHEDMLKLKEQILLQKEKKLEEILKTIMVKGNVLEDTDDCEKKITRVQSGNRGYLSPKSERNVRSPKPINNFDVRDHGNIERSYNNKVVRDI